MENKYSFKAAILGPSQTGKSQLASCLTKSDFAFDEHSESTIGAAFGIRVIPFKDNSSVKIELWDTAGQERYDSLTPMYTREKRILFLVLDANDLDNPLFDPPNPNDPSKKTYATLAAGQAFLESNATRILIINKCDTFENDAKKQAELAKRAQELSKQYQCAAFACISVKTDRIYATAIYQDTVHITATLSAPNSQNTTTTTKKVSTDLLPWVLDVCGRDKIVALMGTTTPVSQSAPAAPRPISSTSSTEARKTLLELSDPYEPKPLAWYVRPLYFLLRHHQEIIVGLIGLTLAVLFFTVPGLQVLGPGALIFMLGHGFAHMGMAAGSALLLSKILLPIVAGVVSFAAGYGLTWAVKQTLPKTRCGYESKINDCVGISSGDDLDFDSDDDSVDENTSCLDSVLGCFSCPPSSKPREQIYQPVDDSAAQPSPLYN